MAISIVMTGTARGATLTSGQSTIVVSNTGLVVGATIQGTGIPTGTRIGSISGTTIGLVNASGVAVTATASGTQQLIFSSVYGSTLTITMSGATDYATPQNIYDAGFGVMSDNIAKREILFPGGLTVIWQDIVAGAVFDFLNWTLEFGVGGRWQFAGVTILGELRGGYLVNGTQFMKTAGPTFYSNSWNNGGAGGSNMWTGTATGAMTGKFRMHNVRFVEYAGSNASFYFAAGRMEMIVENMILDHQGDSAGANASIGAAYGTLKNTYIVKANSGISATNGTNFATFDGLYYVGNYQSTPQHKFSMPNGFTLDGYAPQVTSAQFLGGFANSTTETYSNINLTTAGWGLNDLKTKYQRYGGPNTLNFPRTVAFEFNDSTAANLANVTLYIKSGSTSVINAVQAGDYSANTQALILTWTTTTTSYRVCDSFTDTIAQVAQVRKYGYIEQSTSYSLNFDAYSQPFFMLTDAYLSSISEATASAITTAGINWTTKTITPTADLSYDQINARIAWELAQTTGSANADPRTLSGENLSLATGWSLVVNTGRTISAGTAITYFYAPTVTLNGTGKIAGIYASTAGTSTTFELKNIAAGSSIIIYDSTGTTKLFQQEITTGGDFPYYSAPGTAGTGNWAIERFGYQRQSGSFAFNTGGYLFYEPIYIEDVGITETNKATVAAYTAIETSSKFYDRTAYFRLSEQGIKLGQMVTRSGTSLEIGTFSHKINKDAASVYSVTGSVITTKSTSYAGDSKYSTEIATPPATITANTTEVLTIAIEDANGNSSVTLNGGDGTFELWKVTTSTPTADYATGTLLATVGNVTYRFIGVSGFDIVGVDTNSNIRRRTSMSKGVYTQAFYVGEQIQLAEAPEVIEILTKVEIMQINVNEIQAKTDNMTFTIPNVIDSNIQYVNDIEVKGTGEDNDPWNPVD